jgi:hypothetical protein
MLWTTISKRLFGCCSSLGISRETSHETEPVRRSKLPRRRRLYARSGGYQTLCSGLRTQFLTNVAGIGGLARQDEVPEGLRDSSFSLEFWKPPRKESARINVLILDRSVALCSLSYPSASTSNAALVADLISTTTTRGLFAKISLWCHLAPGSCHKRGEQYITCNQKQKLSKYPPPMCRGHVALPSGLFIDLYHR